MGILFFLHILTTKVLFFPSFWCFIQHWLGEFCRLGHQFQFGEVDPPTENFIDLIRSKSNFPEENGRTFIHISHLQYFLIRVPIFFAAFRKSMTSNMFHIWFHLSLLFSVDILCINKESGGVCGVAAGADSSA